MSKAIVLSPYEICEMFEISKSTLLRWEREGGVQEPKRGKNGKREYSFSHFLEIRDKHAKQLKQQIDREMLRSKSDVTKRHNELKKLMQKAALYKLFSGNIFALYEYEGIDDPSPDTILKLIKIATNHYEPGEHEFNEIIRVVYKQCKQLKLKKETELNHAQPKPTTN